MPERWIKVLCVETMLKTAYDQNIIDYETYQVFLMMLANQEEVKIK